MKLTIIIAILTLATGCASKHKKLLKLPVGVYKHQVLRKFEGPADKRRYNGMDHWIYKSVTKAKNSNEKLLYTHTLSFKDDVLIKKEYERSFTKEEIKEFNEE